MMLQLFSNQLLLRAERAIALLGRCRPRNADAEAVRLSRAWQAGSRTEPRWTYEPVPELVGLRDALRAAFTQVRATPEVRELVAERVAELINESELVESIGRPSLRTLAQRRFQPEAGLSCASELARQWVSLAPPSRTALSVSDDERCSTSLLNRMRAVVGRERLPIRVEVSQQLVSAAATGDGVIIIAAGRELFSDEVERIVVHEVYGHAWPRVRAQAQLEGLFASASAYGNDTQEGYALWCESRAGVMDDRRKRELGLRHLAALSVWEGATWVETTEALLEWGAELSQAVQISSRVHRAGGLAREIVYLPAYCATDTAMNEQPDIQDWLAAGRLSLRAIAVLRGAGCCLCPLTAPAGFQSRNSATTGM